jgi:cytochrome c5
MKKKILIQSALLAAFIPSTIVLAQTPPAPKPAAAAKPATKADPTKLAVDVGQRKFDANCGRCHSFPEQLRPSITGTVVRHMRVRANLSAEDEKDILRFLAP